MAHADLISATPSMHSRRTIRTMCPMNCHPTLCGMLVDVEEGRLVDVRGDPDNPDSRGFLCVRGHAAREIIDNPKRLLHPLIRERRADDAWRRASWDEALDLIASRMQAAGREAVGLWAGHGLFANNYGTRVGSHLLRRFANVWGCQWWNPTMICWGLGAFGLGLTGVLETNTKEDMGEHADLILLWGANLASQPNTGRHLVAARRRGAHLVAIDVRETEAAGQADEVIRIRPGTDAALALAMMHVIVAEARHDARVRRGPRAGVRRARRPRPRALAGVGRGRHRHSRGAHRRPRPALRGDEARDDRARRQLDAQGRQRLAGRARDRLPARADREPRHSRGRLRPPPRLPRARPGSDGHHGARAPPAGSLHPQPDVAGHRGSRRWAAARAAALRHGHALVLRRRGRVAAGLARTDLVVCHDLFMNDTARRFADVVLPSTSWLEEVGCKSTNTHLYLMDQALEPPGETRPLDPHREGTRRAARGLGELFPWSER